MKKPNGHDTDGFHSGDFIDTHPNGGRIIACEPCGFKHVMPLPSAEELRDYYAKRYYSQTKPEYVANAKLDAAWWSLVYAERYAMFASLLEPDQRTILDVGSGPGFFLAEGRRQGWDGIGLEPAPQARDFSTEQLGLTVFDLPFTEDALDTHLPVTDFAVINFSEVLEHVPDPFAMLRLAHNRLMIGGLVCVVVPNDYNPLQRSLREKHAYTPWWLAWEHLNYFDPPSLYGLLRKAGFSVADVSGTFPMELFLFMGQDYVQRDGTRHEDVGRECHRLRMKMETNMEFGGLGDARRQLYAALAKRGYTRDIVMVAKKLRASTATDLRIDA